VWVGTGTPRQDHFVARYTAMLGCTVVPVGAAFDFNSGHKRAAPRLIKRIGMEWLFRFAMEPRRLWRRYLIGIPVFMFGVLTDLGRRRPARPASPQEATTAQLHVPSPRRATADANAKPRVDVPPRVDSAPRVDGPARVTVPIRLPRSEVPFPGAVQGQVYGDAT